MPSLQVEDSPLSNTVPAVKESSESCSALQAYKARALRSGELQKESIYWHKKYSTRPQQHSPPHCVEEGSTQVVHTEEGSKDLYRSARVQGYTAQGEGEEDARGG